VFMPQVLPFFDPKVIALFHKYEKAVHHTLD
jgi:hypothetical protein